MEWIVIPVVVALGIGLHQWLPQLIVRPRRQLINLDPQDVGYRFESITLRTTDGLQLSAFYVPTTAVPRASVVLLHGKDSAKEFYLEYLSQLVPYGYNVLLYDARAHGRSEGIYTTFGYHERRDVLTAVDRLRHLAGEDLPTGVFGHSMGGAVALQAMVGRAAEIDFGIVESTFTHLGDITQAYATALLGATPPRWFTDYLLDSAEKMALFKHREVVPIEAARHVIQPVMIVHGEADRSIDVDNGRQLYAALASERKELYIVPGGGHDDLTEVGNDGYWWRLRAFLQSVSTRAYE